MKTKTLYFLLFICLPLYTFAQKDKLKAVNEEKPKKFVQQYNEFDKTKPREVRLSIHLDLITREISVLLTDYRYFDEYFSNKNDGLAIDIINKNQFSCSRLNNAYPINDDNFYGEIHKIIYKEEIQNTYTRNNIGYLKIPIGRLPRKYTIDDVEINFWLIKKNYLVDYHTTYHIDQNYLSLFKIPLKVDHPKNKKGYTSATLSKNLKKTVYFKKGDVLFNKDELDSLHNALQLTNHNITNIHIKAYSSVEGNQEKNTSLQYLRAENIITELAPYMSKNVTVSIEQEENWSDFFEDIKETKYSDFVNLSRGEIRDKLKEKNILENLSPILDKHRKVDISVSLKLITEFKNTSSSQLVEMFGQSIQHNDLDRALFLQSIIQERVKYTSNKDDILEKLIVPKKPEYISILNNQIVYDFDENDNQLFSVRSSIDEMLTLLPNNFTLKFNQTVILIKLWFYTEEDLESEIITNLNYLKKNGVNKVDLDKIQFNYLIVKTIKAQKELNYIEKNDCIKKITRLFKSYNITEDELIRLSKFYINYSNKQYAIDLISSAAVNNSASEELLFYYLNLTIINPDYFKKDSYKEIIYKAISKNRLRFCGFFNSMNDGGITFQLLGHPYLKKIYCEECNQIEN
ncbi:hypothetical protein EI427_08370 [Flammeovirga pectinis]|uniref:DUF3868 domain-containing protein n=1 Tax=Flammeovirga pectinis TaxID=2494373 RepID=A0A3S9P245_9BACT|nr:hypothetical protein [Flammeovirga pectinis]AZQ62250.1 hypothetical protein EI427_08370 [Flammeovirga pectinis]